MNIKELLDKLIALKNSADAKRFLIEHFPSNPKLWNDIKYATGYLNAEERNRILNLFQVNDTVVLK